MRFCCLVVRTKIIGKTFQSLHEEEIGELLAKNIYKLNLLINNTLSKMNSTSLEVSTFYLFFFKLGIILNE